jgi:hypothetical protein
MEQTEPQKRPSLTEVVPALHAWLAMQEGQSFGIFHEIVISKLSEPRFAQMALEQAKASADKQTIELAKMLVALSSMQRRKLSSIWHFYDPTPKNVSDSKPERRSMDASRRG